MPEVLLRRQLGKIPLSRGEVFTGKIIVGNETQASGLPKVTYASRVPHQLDEPAVNLTTYQETSLDQREMDSTPRILRGRDQINAAGLREARSGLLPGRRLVVTRQ